MHPSECLRTQASTTGTLATEIPLNMETNACAWYTGRDVYRYFSKRIAAEMLSLLLPIEVPADPPTLVSAAKRRQEEAQSGFTGQNRRTRAPQRLAPFDQAFAAYAREVWEEAVVVVRGAVAGRGVHGL
jgi:hypothetical protein